MKNQIVGYLAAMLLVLSAPARAEWIVAPGCDEPLARTLNTIDAAVDKTLNQVIGLTMVTAVSDRTRLQGEKLYSSTDRLIASIKDYQNALKEFGAKIGCGR